MKRCITWLIVLLLTAQCALAVDLSPLDRFETGATQPTAERTSEPESTPKLEPEPVPTPARTPKPTATPDPNAPFFHAMIDGRFHEFNSGLEANIYTDFGSKNISMQFSASTPNGILWYRVDLGVPTYVQQGDVLDANTITDCILRDILRDGFYSAYYKKHDDAYVRLEITSVSEDWKYYEGLLDAKLYMSNEPNAESVEITDGAFRVMAIVKKYDGPAYNPDPFPFGF